MALMVMPYLLQLLFILNPTKGELPLTCPSKPHWNYRAKIVCNNTDDYRCLWDANNRLFIEQCEGYDIQMKGFRKIIEGDITAGDCTENRYQPRMWTTKGNYDCEFDKSLCNDIGQVVYDDGDGLTDRMCGCNYRADYVFLQEPKHKCYCIPSLEDCTCIRKYCPTNHTVDPDYECRHLLNWKLRFECKEITRSASSTVLPDIIKTSIEESKSEKTFSNKYTAAIAVAVVTVVPIVLGIGLICFTIGNKEYTGLILEHFDSNKRRWLLIGIALHTVISPSLRKLVTEKISKMWHDLNMEQLEFNQLKELFEELNFKVVNTTKWNQNNLRIISPVEFSKLFVKPKMATYTDFDEECDVSALLEIFINTGVFPHVSNMAEKIREQIQNEWILNDFTRWDETNYKYCSDLMKQFIKDLGLLEVVDQLDSQNKKGENFIKGGTNLGEETITAIQTQTSHLKTHFKGKSDISGIIEEFQGQIDALKKKVKTNNRERLTRERKTDEKQPQDMEVQERTLKQTEQNFKQTEQKVQEQEKIKDEQGTEATETKRREQEIIEQHQLEMQKQRKDTTILELKLNNTEQQLKQTKQQLEQTKQQLEQTKQQLEQTKQELKLREQEVRELKEHLKMKEDSKEKIQPIEGIIKKFPRGGDIGKTEFKANRKRSSV